MDILNLADYILLHKILPKCQRLGWTDRFSSEGLLPHLFFKFEKFLIFCSFLSVSDPEKCIEYRKPMHLGDIEVKMEVCFMTLVFSM